MSNNPIKGIWLGDSIPNVYLPPKSNLVCLKAKENERPGPDDISADIEKKLVDARVAWEQKKKEEEEIENMKIERRIKNRLNQKNRRKKKTLEKQNDKNHFVDPSVRARVYSKDPQKKAEEQRLYRRNDRKNK